MLFGWTPTDADMVFEYEIDRMLKMTREVPVTGPPPNVPATIASGHWAVGLGVGARSDVADEPDAGHVTCAREFEVTDSVDSVSISVVFGNDCRIAIILEPPLDAHETTSPVAPWTPPPDGVLDDCHNRTLLVRIDANNQIWYEDVASGKRINEGRPWWQDWTIQRSGIDVALVSPDGSEVIPEWTIEGQECVFESGGVAWIGDAEARWQAWHIALEDRDQVAQAIVQTARGNPPAVPPPAAVAITSPPGAPNRAMLRALDAEIRSTGRGGWSTTYPEYFLGGHREVEMEGAGALGFDSDRWLLFPGGLAGSGNYDGWTVRHVVEYETPGGNAVSTLGEALTVWEDCGSVVVPPIYPGPFEPGYETGIDEQNGLFSLFIYEEDGDDGTQLIVDYTNPFCRSHPVLGPMIDHLLADD